MLRPCYFSLRTSPFDCFRPPNANTSLKQVMSAKPSANLFCWMTNNTSSAHPKLAPLLFLILTSYSKRSSTASNAVLGTGTTPAERPSLPLDYFHAPMPLASSLEPSLMANHPLLMILFISVRTAMLSKELSNKASLPTLLQTFKVPLNTS